MGKEKYIVMRGKAANNPPQVNTVEVMFIFIFFLN